MHGHIVNTSTHTQAKITYPSVFSVTIETNIYYHWSSDVRPRWEWFLWVISSLNAPSLWTRSVQTAGTHCANGKMAHWLFSMSNSVFLWSRKGNYVNGALLATIGVLLGRDNINAGTWDCWFNCLQQNYLKKFCQFCQCVSIKKNKTCDSRKSVKEENFLWKQIRLCYPSGIFDRSPLKILLLGVRVRQTLLFDWDIYCCGNPAEKHMWVVCWVFYMSVCQRTDFFQRDSFTNTQDAVTKLHWWGLKIKIRAEFEIGLFCS